VPARLRALSVSLVALTVWIGPLDVSAQTWRTTDNPLLVIELWTELDPLVADGGERPVPREVAVRRLLDEAIFVLSGMIYGFRFAYVPADPARRVPERLDLEPYAAIVWGDHRLEILQTWVDRDRLYARVYYTVDEAQTGWYRAWRSAANASSSGIGTAPFIAGPTVKPDATRDAIRVAIRNHARALEPNRPQRVTGAVMIAEPPIVGIREGNYESRLTVLLQIDSIRRYEHY
jgi:hypothetical protein